MINIKRINLVFIIILMMITVGCVDKNTVATRDVKENVTIETSRLFTDGPKGIEHHLGLIGGRINIRYNGEKQWIQCGYEIWENGEVVEDLGLCSIKANDNMDLSISLKQIFDNDLNKSENMIMTTSLYGEGGNGGSSTRYIKGFSDQSGYSTSELSNDIIKSKDKGPIYVWCIVANENSRFSMYGDIRKNAREHDWALVLKIEFVDEVN